MSGDNKTFKCMKFHRDAESNLRSEIHAMLFELLYPLLFHVLCSKY